MSRYYLQSVEEAFPLRAGQYTLGRSPDCELCFPNDRRLSRQHLRLNLESDGLWVEDLGSSNGTFVQGRRVQRRRLSVGEVLRAGDCELLVCEGNPVPTSTNKVTVRELPSLDDIFRTGPKVSPL